MRAPLLTIGSTNRHARELRRQATPAERRLWQHVRNRQLGGHKFRQQATIGYQIADFLCAEKRLVVELDGGQHGGPEDDLRTAELERLGYRVIRFWNNEVLENLDAVLERILTECEALPSRFRGKEPSSNSD
jgi:very-short-patch-repair endonuclease